MTSAVVSSLGIIAVSIGTALLGIFYALSMSRNTDYNYSTPGSISDEETRERCWLDYKMEHKMANRKLKMATTIHGTSI